MFLKFLKSLLAVNFCRLSLGGGGGGNSGQVYYENQDKLLGVQADIAQNMYNQYAKYAPTRLDAMSRMADEAMDGSLAERMRTQASADAGQALSSNLGAINRNMGRYGANFNPDRMASMMMDAGVQGAAMKTGAMNNANQWAENQKWARNQDMYSALAGMPSNAVSALNSAASGYGQMGGDQTRLQVAGAQGAGQFGSAMAYGLMKADGGAISRDDAPGYAMGGMPQLSDWRQRSSGVRAPQSPGALQSVVAGAAPVVGMNMATDALRPYVGAAKEGIGNAVKGWFGGNPTHVYSATPTEAWIDAGGLGGGSAATDAAATTAATDAGSAMAAIPEAAAAAVPEATAAATAAELAPEALALLALANGGAVPRQGGLRRDFRPGGKVAGPGTETSDSIPAWLSDKEFVNNAESTQLAGKQTLDAINNEGLKVRRGQKSKPEAKKAVKKIMRKAGGK